LTRRKYEQQSKRRCNVKNKLLISSSDSQILAKGYLP
jgi:hypothetical protein